MSSNNSGLPRIAIIGGGLGGLSLLLTLHRRGVPATLYERDPAFDARAHLGGSLDLGWKSGQRALPENGLQDAFDKNSRPEGEDLRVCDGTGKVHLKLGGEGDTPKPKEDISLAPETTKLPALAETVANVGKGTMFAMEDSRILGAQVNGDGRIRTYAWLRAPESWTVPSDSIAARAALKEEFTGWAGWILNLIDYLDESAIYPRSLWSLPVGHKWTHVPGVTLLGDAAHLMSPFAGAGANLALLDGLELGLALADLKEKGTLSDISAVSEAVKAFEENMCAMAGRVAEKANGNLAVCIGPDTPQAMIQRLWEQVGNGEREG
ncbi:hypothetical protein GSI_02611 [Ganoderma sinense ZZ0214-1]|uniref:FAD-binding domain-containing protein n=1 Tax=Ganoderma sinense ZZ0214-1 TaxID=1077348 RepID=A0A2G8SM33_9APHY|nr:hypothetical protein GSI_02611 [Ganoderma sinense ZZ0214-1]